MKLLTTALGCNAAARLLAAALISAACFGQSPKPAPTQAIPQPTPLPTPARGRATVFFAMDNTVLAESRKAHAAIVHRSLSSKEGI